MILQKPVKITGALAKNEQASDLVSKVRLFPLTLEDRGLD